MAGLASIAVASLALPPSLIGVSVVVFGAAMAVAIATVAAHHPFGRLGPANVVTTVRTALVAIVCGALLTRGDSGAWLAVATASLAACLDGLDGYLARRTSLGSAFGARFDMEVDALLILVLSAGVFWFGKAGAWVLLSGLLRYAFIVAGWALVWMRQSLPESLRRKTVCVIQIVGLIVAVAPIVPPLMASGVAAATLLLLAWSFAVDVVWLARARRAA